ncbi:uncharacterized protein [Physcomitrium patens]|uniref:uncharacterized protein isoform X2 n=1 Tax=Physcomitrium patens TaxID=3218 RepID=UPI003CCCA992
MKSNNASLCYDCEFATARHRGNSELCKDTDKRDTTSKKRNDNKENLSDYRRVLLSITVEIQDECVEHIHFKEGDSAEVMAIKFCEKHCLPEQFVAPLAEQIVSNIIPVSDFVFYPQENRLSNDENSTLHSGSSQSPLVNGSDGDALHNHRDCSGRQNVISESNAWLGSREVRTPMLFQASQRVNSYQGQGQGCQISCEGKPRRKSRRKKWSFSDHVIAQTFASLAKKGAYDHYQRKPERLAQPLSEQAKAVCMRLNIGRLRHKHTRCWDEAKCRKTSYQEHVVRKQGISKKSRRIMWVCGRRAKQYKNYGELLYAKGVTMRQNHLKAVYDKKKQNERREAAELTLKPNISKRARNMRRGRGQVWSRLQSDDRPKQDQLQELRQMAWEAKLMECTFKPQINQRYKDSQDQYADDHRNCFEQLFLDAECRRRRRDQCTQWCPEGLTFQPSINKSLPYRTSMMGEDWKSECSVFRRLLDNASRVTKKKEAQQQWSHRPFDQRTGRELFKPHIGRKPYNRNPVCLSIGEYLHRMKNKFDNKMRCINARKDITRKDQTRGRFVGPNSQKLLERLKDRRFKQIFAFLDKDKNGYVDLMTADVDRLNQDVIGDINRVKRMIGSTDNKLDFDRLVDLMRKNKYQFGQQLLGPRHKAHNLDVNCTFQFKMDRLSRNLAKTRRKYSTHEQWWEIMFAEFLASERKVASIRKERQQQELLNCPFKPYLTPYRLKKARTRVNILCGNAAIDEKVGTLTEKTQDEVQGFYFQNEQGGPELLGMPTQGEPVSPEPGISRGRADASRSDVVAQLDDLPKLNTSKAKVLRI